MLLRIGISIVFLLTGCASQFAESYVGKSVVDLELENGEPVNVVELPDGRRSYQYYWGGGTYVIPQTTTGTVSVIGSTATVNTTTQPAAVVTSKGCLINFIARKESRGWIVVEAKWPERLVC